jgi:hypothetical protein
MKQLDGPPERDTLISLKNSVRELLGGSPRPIGKKYNRPMLGASRESRRVRAMSHRAGSIWASEGARKPAAKAGKGGKNAPAGRACRMPAAFIGGVRLFRTLLA